MEGLAQLSSEPLDPAALVINLLIGAVLSLLLKWHFMRFGSTFSNRSSLAAVFPFLVLTVLLIITVVKSSIALSLGLVGALSIVRFRTPIKEPEELAYLFMAIAIGLGLGAGQVIATVVASVVILLLVGIFKLFHNRKLQKQNLYLSVDWKSKDEAITMEDVKRVLGKVFKSFEVRRVDVQDKHFHATFYVETKTMDEINEVVTALQERFSGIAVTFIDQHRVPGV